MWAEVGGGIISGLVSGVLTAAIWSGIAWAYACRRDKKIEQALAEQFFPRSVSMHLGGSQGFPIKNDSAHTVTVREVALFGLVPQGHEGLTLTFGFDAAKSHGACRQLPGGWVELPPGVSGTWIAPSNQMVQGFGGSRKIIGCKVLIEYKTLLGATKLLTVKPSPDSQWQKMIAEHYNQYYGFANTT